MVLVGDVYERVQPLVSELRGRGLNVAVDMTGRKPGDQIKNATKKSIEHVLFVGDKELSENRYNLKNIVTGDEQNLDVDGIVIALSGRK
jgi:histidyl-tRNA synthetase